MKIKDLVTVTVDTAYSLFPIDSERYELIVAIRDIVATPDGAAMVTVDHPDSRIQEFLVQTYQNFSLGAECAGKVYLSSDTAHVSAITIDRARRCEASFTAWYWHNSVATELEKQFQDDFNHLWLELLLGLLNEPEAVRIEWNADKLDVSPVGRASFFPRINNVPKR